MEWLIRALPAYFQALPYAASAALFAGVAGWTIWREQRPRLQRASIGAAFGLGVAFSNYPLTAAAAYEFYELDGYGRAVAYEYGNIVAAITSVVTALVTTVVAAACFKRWIAALMLFLTGWLLTMMFFTWLVVAR